MVAPPAISTECTHQPMRHFRVSGQVTALIQDGTYLQISIYNGTIETTLSFSNVEMCDLPKWVNVGESVEFDSETMRITKG